MSERTDDKSFQEYSWTDDEKRLFDEREKEWSNMLKPETSADPSATKPGNDLPQSDSELSYNAFDSLPKIKFPQYQSGEGVYGKPVEYKGTPYESTTPYNIIRTEEKDGTYYHFADTLPTRKLTPGESDVASGLLGLPIGALGKAKYYMFAGANLGNKINPLAGETGALLGAAGGAIYGGMTGYNTARNYFDNDYHHPVTKTGNHVFIENDIHNYP